MTPTSGSWTFANEVGGSVDNISSVSSGGGGSVSGSGSVEGGSSSNSSLAAR